jgi:hypothetical protein
MFPICKHLNSLKNDGKERIIIKKRENYFQIIDIIWLIISNKKIVPMDLVEAFGLPISMAYKYLEIWHKKDILNNFPMILKLIIRTTPNL